MRHLFRFPQWQRTATPPRVEVPACRVILTPQVVAVCYQDFSDEDMQTLAVIEQRNGRVA